MTGEACILCGGLLELAARPIATWRRTGEGIETRVLWVATCVRCRTRIGRLKDARDVATAPTSEAHRRFRACDTAGSVLIAALGFVVAAAAGWIGGWGFWAAAALATGAAPTYLIARLLLDTQERDREPRWEASEVGAEHAKLERRVRESWQRAARRIREETGFATEHPSEEGALRALDESALVDPSTWAPRSDDAVSYLVVRDDGTVERRQLDRRGEPFS